MPVSPTVSLLIPTFNNGDTVAQSIVSCMEQTFDDLEILIYDEASKDNTREVLTEAAQRDKRIRVMMSEENSGPVLAWRKLLHAARGQWSTFVWSDDLLTPRYLEKLLAVLKENPTHLLAGCNSYIDFYQPSESAVFTAYKPTAKRALLHDFPSLRLPGDAYALGILAGVFPVNQISSLFDTQAAREVFEHYIQFENPYGFDFSRRAYGNDVAFLSELALRSGELIQIGEPLVVVRDSPGSMTTNARRTHRWQFRLQYVWAFRAAWRRNRHRSPRMETLIRVADDRVSFCDAIYSLQQRQWPREFSPVKLMRALWFLLRHDRRMNKQVSPATVQAWLARHAV